MSTTVSTAMLNHKVLNILINYPLMSIHYLICCKIDNYKTHLFGFILLAPDEKLIFYFLSPFRSIFETCALHTLCKKLHKIFTFVGDFLTNAFVFCYFCKQKPIIDLKWALKIAILYNVCCLRGSR